MVREPYRFRCPFPGCRSVGLKRRVSYFNGTQHGQRCDHPYYCPRCKVGVFAKFDKKRGKAVVE